ncbi:MAG: hypothetical protein IRY95_07735 [Clostridia bacterium]|nr:hypothetical protein [Clostridia bacterium]
MSEKESPPFRAGENVNRYAPGGEPRAWTGPDAVIEEPVLPGFSCRLAELLGEG